MDHGAELPGGEEAVEDRLAHGLGVGHPSGHAGPQDPPAGHGQAQLGGHEPQRVHHRGSSAHDGGIQLHGDDDVAAPAGGHVGAEHQLLCAGGGVDDRDVVFARHVVQREAQRLLGKQQLVLVDERQRGRDDAQVVGSAVVGHLVGGHALVEQPDDVGAVLRLLVEAEVVRRRRLGVQVDQQRPLSVPRAERGQVDGGRGLAHAALEVAYGDYPHGLPP